MSIEAGPHSPNLTLLHLHHSSFSNPSAALPMSQLILQPFRWNTYVIGTSPTSPGVPPMPLWWCLIYPWWSCNLHWLWSAGLYERFKLALELKRLKTPALEAVTLQLKQSAPRMKVLHFSHFLSNIALLLPISFICGESFLCQASENIKRFPTRRSKHLTAVL